MQSKDIIPISFYPISDPFRSLHCQKVKDNLNSLFSINSTFIYLPVSSRISLKCCWTLDIVLASEKLIYCVLQLNARDLWLVVCNVLSQIYMTVDPSFFGLTTKSPVFHTQTCFFFYFGNFHKYLVISSFHEWLK